MLRLRRLDGNASRLAAAADAWRARGWQTSLEHLPRMGSWMLVQDTSHTWQGWVEPGMWLEGVAHELASLACCADSEQLAARLFAVTACPLHLPMPELRYDMLDVGAPVDGAALPEAKLLKVRARECPVWLTRVPEVSAVLPLDLSDVRFWLNVELGHSRIRLSTLRSTQRGDVLLIRDVQRRLSSGATVIGGYQYEEGSAMLETYGQADTSDVDDNDFADAPTFETPAAFGMQSRRGDSLPFEQLPVELVFVLQRDRMTLGDLQQLGRTQLLPMQHGAEQRVEVRVNGTLLARGELVQLDGRLGVEISEWMMPGEGDGGRGSDEAGEEGEGGYGARVEEGAGGAGHVG